MIVTFTRMNQSYTQGMKYNELNDALKITIDSCRVAGALLNIRKYIANTIECLIQPLDNYTGDLITRRGVQPYFEEFYMVFYDLTCNDIIFISITISTVIVMWFLIEWKQKPEIDNTSDKSVTNQIDFYNIGYKGGYNIGYVDGYSIGKHDWYDDGYVEGYGDGHDEHLIREGDARDDEIASLKKKIENYRKQINRTFSILHSDKRAAGKVASLKFFYEDENLICLDSDDEDIFEDIDLLDDDDIDELIINSDEE